MKILGKQSVVAAFVPIMKLLPGISGLRGGNIRKYRPPTVMRADFADTPYRRISR
jgi:hypothetical protein